MLAPARILSRAAALLLLTAGPLAANPEQQPVGAPTLDRASADQASVDQASADAAFAEAERQLFAPIPRWEA
ncbi:MAG: hypothetical protein DCF30_14990, partial [Hyphomicrobiales bacterium]